MTRSEEIEKVELTPEEISLAIWQAKYVKWNKERFRDYWEELEKQKPNESKEFSKGKADAPTHKAGPHLVEKRSKKRGDKAYSTKG